MPHEDETTPESNTALTEKLDAMWANAAGAREEQQERQEYYDGEHAITKRSETYADGSKKTNRVTNWMRYIIDMFTGALTTIDYQVTPKRVASADDADDRDAGEGVEGAAIYAGIAEDNRLPTQDAENYLVSMTQGLGVEVHSFNPKDGGMVKINNFNGINWVIVYDENQKIVGGQYRVQLQVGTEYKGVLLSEPLVVMRWYDSEQILEFHKAKSEDGKEEWKLSSDPQVHHYGQPPLVVWRINEGHKSYLSNAILRQNDEYNDIDSASGDDIRNDTDAILVLRGLDQEWLMEIDEAAKQTNMSLLRADKALALPASVTEGPYYLTKGNDVTRVESRLVRTRDHIHMMGAVPDVEQIVGATGDTSGIALRLKFMPMIQVAGQMINYVRGSMWDRIDLINVILAKQGAAQIEGVKIVVQFSLPVNRMEEWKNIKELKDIVSDMTLLELLSDVDDPAAELERILEQRRNVIGTDLEDEVKRERLENQPDVAPELQTAQTEADIARAVPGFSAGLQPVLDEVSIIRDELLSGLAETTAELRAGRNGG